MRIRFLAASGAVAGLLALPLAGTAAARTDRDCADFPTQAAAQAAFDARPGDPERLDADGDGYACESRFGPRPTTAASTTPSTTRPTTVPPSTTRSGTASTTPPRPSTTTAQRPAQIVAVPRGGVETGDGASSDGTDPAVGALGLVAVGGAAALGAGVAARRATRRNS